MCANLHCLDQCTNKVDRNTSPVTAGLRATLHRFFPTPDRAPSSNNKEDEDNKEDSGEPGPDRAPGATYHQGKEPRDPGAQEEMTEQEIRKTAKDFCLDEAVENCWRADTSRPKADKLLWRTLKDRRRLHTPNDEENYQKWGGAGWIRQHKSKKRENIGTLRPGHGRDVGMRRDYKFKY